MALSRKVYTHNGLRYRWDSVRKRAELVDHPGHIERNDLGAFRWEFVAFCDECTECAPLSSFDAAIGFLITHVSKHHLEQREQDKRERELSQGFVVDKIASGGERARCIHAGCTYVSATYAVGPMGAFDAGTKHVASAHPDNRIANPGKDTTMRTLTQIDRELELAQARLEHLLAERAERAKLPTEPDVDNIAFEVQFAPGGIKYSYGAQRARGVWFLTGRTTDGKTWDEVLDFIGQDHRVQAGTRRLQFRELESGRVVKAAK